MLIKQRSLITSQKCGSWGFQQIANNVLNKGKSAILPLFNGPETLSSAPHKAKLFALTFFATNFQKFVCLYLFSLLELIRSWLGFW